MEEMRLSCKLHLPMSGPAVSQQTGKDRIPGARVALSSSQALMLLGPLRYSRLRMYGARNIVTHL